MLLGVEISFLHFQKNNDAQNRPLSSKVLATPESLRNKLTHWGSQVCTGWFGNILVPEWLLKMCGRVGLRWEVLGHRNKCQRCHRHWTIWQSSQTHCLWTAKLAPKLRPPPPWLTLYVLHLVAFFSSSLTGAFSLSCIPCWMAAFATFWRSLASSASFLILPYLYLCCLEYHHLGPTA